MKKFTVTEEEKRQIIEQHKSRGYKTTINENTEPKTKIKTGEELNDTELKKRACTTWNRWKSISKDDAIMKAKEWTKTVTGNKYPYDMDVACKSTNSTSVIGSDTDRMVLKGVIELEWIGQSGQLNEDQETYNYNMAIQCFLNKKGVKDDSGQPLKMDGSIGNWPKSKSAQAIAKYQTMIKVYPTDGVWGPDTMDKMPEADKEIFKDCVSEHGDFIQKGLHLFGLD